MNKYVLFLPLLAFNVISSFASTEATFSLVANTPTSITVPANRHAIVQYKVTNNTAVTRTLTMAPIPNVTQLTNDPSQCSNPFTLAHNQSCNLTLYVEGSLQKSHYVGGPIICKTNGNSNTPDPLLCSQPECSMALSIYPAPAVIPSVNKLYVSNWSGGSISLCYIDTAGELTDCQVSAVSGTFLNPEALAIKDDYLFVANIGGGMSSCKITAGTGELTNCINAINNVLSSSQIHAPDGIAIKNNKAYISNSGPESNNQGVTTCTVESEGILAACSFTKGNASFATPSDLAVLNDTVYITNFNDQSTTYCTITGDPLCTTTGSITGTGNLLNEPEGLFITLIGVKNYAYFTNHGDHTVTLCDVASSHSFTSCANTDGYFSGFGNLTILNSPLKAFIPSGLNSIAICDVSDISGTLSNCVNPKNTHFNNPSGLVIN